MDRRLSILAGLAVSVLVASCQAPMPYSHPQYERFQREIQPIVEDLHTSTGMDLFATMQRLIAYDVFAVDLVAKLGSDPNPRVRSNALYILSHIKDSGFPAVEDVIEDHLRAGLRDEDQAVRYEAAVGLLSRNHWDVIPVILEGMCHNDAGIRYRCHESLRQVTSRDFGYAANANDSARQSALEMWQAWYKDWQATSS